MHHFLPWESTPIKHTFKYKSFTNPSTLSIDQVYKILKSNNTTKGPIDHDSQVIRHMGHIRDITVYSYFEFILSLFIVYL